MRHAALYKFFSGVSARFRSAQVNNVKVQFSAESVKVRFIRIVHIHVYYIIIVLCGRNFQYGTLRGILVYNIFFLFYLFCYILTLNTLKKYIISF